MQLRDALSDLKEIRAQLDRTHEFCGFRSLAVAVSGVLAIIGAMLQLSWQCGTQGTLREFLVIWLCVAIGSLVVAGVEMWVRGLYGSTKLLWKTHRRLAMQIAPSFFVGAILTTALVCSDHASWMLPGMWAMVYSLGLFACWQHLPRLTLWAAVYFLLGGTVCLWNSFLARGVESSTLSAWYMAVLFGGGQLLLGWILYWTLERNRHGQEVETT